VADDNINTFSDEATRKIVDMVVQRMRGSISRQLTAVRRHEGAMMSAETITVHNASGEAIPAFGVMRITSYSEANDLYEVDKPSDTFKCRYLVNTDYEIAEDGTGDATWLEKSGAVLYNDASGTPAISRCGSTET
jgi:hypothetical protein